MLCRISVAFKDVSFFLVSWLWLALACFWAFGGVCWLLAFCLALLVVGLGWLLRCLLAWVSFSVLQWFLGGSGVVYFFEDIADIVTENR